MRFARTRALALALLAGGAAAGAAAEDRCLVKGKMQDQSFELKSCAVAMYDQKGVTIWFTEKPLSAAEVEKFQLGSYADLSGTSMYMAFCPGGAKGGAADAKAPGSYEWSVEHASSPMLMQSFLFKSPADKAQKIEKLTGELKPGGRLAGKIRVSTKLDQGQAYSWDADFDVALPAKGAAAGPGCGD
jgi:hypothetical protein